MKLELKHLAGYLPYMVESRDKTNSIYRRNLAIDNIETFLSGGFILILRPLSDLAKEIEVNGEKFIPINRMEMYGYYDKQCLNLNQVKSISFNMIQYLLEWHFDIYGLIENGLAIDINTL